MWLINYTADKSEPSWHGYIYVMAIFVAKAIESIFYQKSSYESAIVALRLRTSVISAIYRKALRLSPVARQSRTVGEIVNLMAVDAGRIKNVVNSRIHTLWSAPLQVMLSLVFLYNLIGVSALGGFGFFVVLVPLNGVISHYYNKYDELQMEQKDHRIKLLNEILNGIKIIKLYAWETAFEKKVTELRNQELGFLKRGIALGGGLEFIWGSSELFCSVISFSIYVLLGNSLTPAVAFVSLSLFSKMLFSVNMLPLVLSDCIQLGVSIKRLGRFFLAEELPPLKERTFTSSEENLSIDIRDGTFRWGDEEPPTLRDINLKIRKGSLVGIIGRVGSGKSSLISALCADLQIETGEIHVEGSLGYASQQAWIQNMTLRDNVLFDNPLEEDKYCEVVEATALKPDLEILTNGDLTEIGERGINLSGGQKQRVALARAVYHDADVYLLDDPLSAVDVHVGKHIFENIIGHDGLLQHKTRLLVTHSLTYLSECDTLVVMQDGCISEQGTYTDLMEKGGVFCKLIQEFLKEAPEEELKELDKSFLTQLSSSPVREIIKTRLSQTTSDTPRSFEEFILETRCSLDSDSVPEFVTRLSTCSNEMVDHLSKPNDTSVFHDADERGRLVDDESVNVGKVSWHVYWSYLRSAGLGMFLYIVFLCLDEACYIGSSFWLQHWSDSVTSVHPIPTTNALTIYASFLVGQNIFCLILVVAFWFGQMRAAKIVHSDMLRAVFKAPMSFFDTNPSGRIINRFSKDVNSVDNEIASCFDAVLHQMFFVLQSVILIIYVIPWFTLILIPLAFIYFLLLKFYVSTSRQLRRLNAVARSPIYSHFQETLQGVSVIRAFKQKQRFTDHSDYLMDQRNRVEICNCASNRWLGILLEFFGNIVVCSAALLAVIERDSGISAGMMGLSISYAMNVMEGLSYGVRMAAQLETQIVSMERIEEFKNTKSEAAWRSEDSPVNDSWPAEGAISFCRYSTRYRPGLDMALNDVNIYIAPSEKVGIVGRTGAGKSSMTLALFRLIEPAEGSIFVDGLSLADCGLHDIREKFSIIPQDPVLFSGTLRLNLDPFDQYTDEELWNALGVAHLKSYVAGLSDKFMHHVGEGGSNISVGQRQLICLARAVLRQSKVVVLDEATAAVDVETDCLVQQTIRKYFVHSTVITIAHRINTVLDSDKILVLDGGQVVEFGPPHELLQNKDSTFYKMVEESGIIKL